MLEKGPLGLKVLAMKWTNKHQNLSLWNCSPRKNSHRHALILFSWFSQVSQWSFVPLAVFYIFSSFEKWSSKTKINSQSSVNLSRLLSILEVAETSYFWCLIPSEDSKIASFCQLHHRRELIIGFRKPLSTSWLKANIWLHPVYHFIFFVSEDII